MPVAPALEWNRGNQMARNKAIEYEQYTALDLLKIMTYEARELERRYCYLLQLVNHASALPSASAEESLAVTKDIFGWYIFELVRDRAIKV